MLTHHRQIGDMSGEIILHFDVADPFGDLLVPHVVSRIMRLLQQIEAIFIVARLHAAIAAVGAFCGIDQHAPAHGVCNSFTKWFGFGRSMQHDARRHSYCRDCRAFE